ncbi:hypothetical protein [Marinomonas sp. ef1]|jgi:hypothetical protein|uniref:hypothetical protein n=1 Tax=Marinomonas sp. ef1 TaxID=2005043 RepID=UPI000C2874E9|nr:hypothetical protein [Marinomonas sp. ef1]
MSDPYCAPLNYNGRIISGGAARAVRIAQAGGLNNMIEVAVRAGVVVAIQQIFGSSNRPLDEG